MEASGGILRHHNDSKRGHAVFSRIKKKKRSSQAFEDFFAKHAAIGAAFLDYHLFKLGSLVSLPPKYRDFTIEVLSRHISKYMR